LIALSPGTLDDRTQASFLERLELALLAGLPGLLLREPQLDDRRTLALARLVLARRAHHGFWLGLHDRAHLACALEVDALHLSFRSLRPGELAWRPPTLALGLSTHAEDDPRAWRGADYLFHGPLHPTPSKQHPRPVIGLDGLARARTVSDLPILALGGVRPEDARPLRSLGLHGVAVRAGILGATDPAQATRDYLEALR
jgi:thiamine-phosphate diphosphorylase